MMNDLFRHCRRKSLQGHLQLLRRHRRRRTSLM
jgi:hypothetical protein